LNHNEFGITVDDGASGIVDYRLVADYHIAIGVLVGIFVQRTPRAEVAPREQCRYHIYFVMVFHDAVVDADIWTFGIDGVDELGLAVGIIDVHALRKERVDFRLKFLKRLCDSIDIPNENARVPEKLAAFEESLRHLEVWLFGEELHPCYLVDSKRIVV